MKDIVVCRKCGNRMLEGLICCLCQQKQLYIEAEQNARIKFMEHNHTLLGEIIDKTATITFDGIDVSGKKDLINPDFMTTLNKATKSYINLFKRLKRYRLTFKRSNGAEIYEDIVTESLKMARHEGRVISTLRGGLKFIKATKI